MSESRLFQILYHLLIKGESTASELAEKFEVSTRTIYRDIDKLSYAGIPVYTTSGYKGGIHLDENFCIEKSILSKEDMQNILMSVQSMSALDFPETDSVITKLQALFQMDKANWMEVDYSRWGCDTNKEREILRLLKKAIQEMRQIHFKYYNSKGEASERDCCPLKIVFKDRAWYLYGYCLKKNSGRIFRISRIIGLEITNQYFENIIEENLVFPTISNRIIEMELCFTKENAHRVYDAFDENSIITSENHFIVKVAMPEDEWLYSFLMSFGDGLTILSPIYLKEELKKRFQAALKHLEI